MDEVEERVSERPGKGNKLLILFLVLCSLIFSFVGGGILYAARQQEKESVITEGEIVGYRRNSSYANKRRLSPVVEFQVGDARIQGRSHAWSSHKVFEKGAKVTVGYSPEDLENFYIKEFDLKIRYQVGSLFLLAGVGFLLMMAVFTALGKSRISKKKKEAMEAKLLVLGIVLFVFLGFWFMAGTAITMIVFGGMGAFALYGMYDNKRKK